MIYICSANEIKGILEIRLSKKRFAHSMNVADEAKKLALHYNTSLDEKAYLAGLLHDICKEIPADEQLSYLKKFAKDVSDVELLAPPLYHAPAGAFYIQNVLNINDEDILNAVRYHTIGRGFMSPLEEIIYLADLISADRTYKDVNRMRKIAYQSIDKAMLEALKFSISDNINKGSQFPHQTIECYNYYITKKKQS